MMRVKPLVRPLIHCVVISLSSHCLVAAYCQSPYGHCMSRTLTLLCVQSGNVDTTSTSALKRREAIAASLCFATLSSSSSSVFAATDINLLLKDAEKALVQLQDIPTMIQAEKWDGVRNLLVTPPISSFRKGAIWQDYADAVEAGGGDEFEVLQTKEEFLGSIQRLDMAVYNNIFNPIATQGETGATKELIQSYYEDPLREYKGTKAALEELVRIGQFN